MYISIIFELKRKQKKVILRQKCNKNKAPLDKEKKGEKNNVIGKN